MLNPLFTDKKLERSNWSSLISSYFVLAPLTAQKILSPLSVSLSLSLSPLHVQYSPIPSTLTLPSLFHRELKKNSRGRRRRQAVKIFRHNPCVLFSACICFSYAGGLFLFSLKFNCLRRVTFHILTCAFCLCVIRVIVLPTPSSTVFSNDHRELKIDVSCDPSLRCYLNGNYEDQTCGL